MERADAEKLRILILEHNPADAMRMKRALRKGGVSFSSRRVDRQAEFARELDVFHPDVALCDSMNSGFDGLAALQWVRREHPEIPVIVVTPPLSDVKAVQLMQAGAKDYVLKDQLTRLPSAILHVLAMEHGIRARKEAEHALQEATAKLNLFRALIDESEDGIEVIDPATRRFLDVNEAECRNLGYSREELLSMGVSDIDPAFDKEKNGWIEVQLRENGKARFEGIHRRRDGSDFPVEIDAKLIELEKPYVLSIVRDITERKRAEQTQKRLARALTLLSQCNSTLVHADSEEALLSAICRLAVESAGYMMAWVGFPEKDGKKTVRPVARSGHEEACLDQVSFSWADGEWGNGPTGKAIRTGIIQVSQDCLSNADTTPWRNIALKHGYRSVIALPLIATGETLGVLSIYAKEQDAFNDEEVKLLGEMADDLAFGVSSLRLGRELDRAIAERQRYVEKLRENMEEAVEAISVTLEMRDPYTAGHQRRVADLAVAIARELGLPQEQIHGIRLAAIVHDIGKIQIPSEMLSKPSRLSEIEYSLIKVHSQAGYDILKEIDFPWPIAKTVLQHHERLDGSGYPQGLKGEEIILEARILAVADVVEAISSHRPYRPALGLKTAFEEIRKHSAARYDPAVVEACIRLFLEKEYSFPPVHQPGSLS